MFLHFFICFITLLIFDLTNHVVTGLHVKYGTQINIVLFLHLIDYVNIITIEKTTFVLLKFFNTSVVELEFRLSFSLVIDPRAFELCHV